MVDRKITKVSQTKEVLKRGMESHTTSSIDNPTLHITTVKLDELNYLAWSQFALLY
jgi:hypothetical protein